MFHAAYDPEKWQWAMKMAAFLEDRGHAEVEIREVEEGAGNDDDMEIK